MTLSALYDIAEREQVRVCRFPLPETVSCSFPAGMVVLDEPARISEQLERLCLAHELGHCVTGSFYNQHTALDVRQKHETRANRWAFQMLLPFDELMFAFFDGDTEPWQLSERFGLPEQLIIDAVEYYKLQFG